MRYVLVWCFDAEKKRVIGNRSLALGETIHACMHVHERDGGSSIVMYECTAETRPR